MRRSTWARWSPVSGIVLVALWIATLAVTGNDVSSSDSDGQILAYYADSGHRHKHIAGFFLVLAASLFFVWFLSVLRGRLARAEGGAGALTAAAFGIRQASPRSSTRSAVLALVVAEGQKTTPEPIAGMSMRAACGKRRTLRFTPRRFPRVARAGADRL
jgi:hypothetical protein